MVSSHPAKRIPGMSEEEYFTLLPVLGKKQPYILSQSKRFLRNDLHK